MLLLLTSAFVVSLLACAVLVRLGAAGLMLDQPNARSLHVVPVPRTGGIAIGLGLLPAIVLVYFIAGLQARLLIIGFLAVFVVSLLDDLRDLPAWIRLCVHLAAGLLIVLAPGFPDDPLKIALGLFWIAWGTNLFNFMDGMDGLAGSMALIGGAATSIALYAVGMPSVALLLAAAAAAAAGFLYFNLPPARMFMGDAGSAPLGFLFAASAVNGAGTGRLPAWLPLLVFLPFVADATLTLFRRMLAREPFWRAHRTHAYQRLVIGGWPVKRVLVAEIGVMLLCGAGALLLPRTGSPGWWAFGATAVLVATASWVMIRRIERRESRNTNTLGNSE